MDIELIEEAYAAKHRIRQNERVLDALVLKVSKGQEQSPMEHKHQFGQDFCNLVINDGHNFSLNLSQSGCNGMIIQAIIAILDDKINKDKHFIENL